VRRVLLAILLLGLTSPATATTASAATAPATVRAILRDCEDDGSLTGSYRPSELRDAVRNIGTDLDQYSDCRDVIGAAVLRAVSARDAGGGATPGATGGGAPATGGAAAGGAPGRSEEATADGVGFGTPGTLAPEDRGELEAIEEGRHTAPSQTLVGGRGLDVAAPRGVAAVVAHDLPTPVLVALVALALATLAAALPSLHRRVVARRAP
jgi:hypothetical protein